MQKRIVFLSVFTFLIYTSLLGQTPKRFTREQYIQEYHEWAVMNMRNSGVPASITLAQGMHESGDGNSRLARKANNHFGIKCHDWTGKKVYHHDDRRNECFRKYNSVYDSFSDHARFLSTRPRYAFLFDLDVTDYKGWARGLKKAGYATDPNYAKHLINIIESYELYRFDRDGGQAWRQTKRKRDDGDHVVDPFVKHEVHYNNGIKYIKVQPDDTFSSIANEFGLRDWELPRYNDLNPRGRATDYRYLYISPKRNKAHPDHETHHVEEGETMFEISQIYGVKLKRLYKMNDMREGKDPRPGDKIELR